LSNYFNFKSLISQSSILFCLLNKKHNEKILDSVLETLIESSLTISKENWIESCHAINILGESAKINQKALNSLLLISNLNSTTINYDLNRSICNSSQNNDDSMSENIIASNNEHKKGGIDQWPWELACIYADVLAEVCLNGSQSLIKKKALLGFNKDSNESFKMNRKNIKGYGLLDLARYQFYKRNQEGK
jgi:hypothetical protein